MQMLTDRMAKDMLLALLADSTETQTEVIDEAAKTITSNLDIGEVYDAFVEGLRALVGFDRATINIADEGKGRVTVGYLSPKTGSFLSQGETFPLEDSTAGYVAQTRRTLILGDLEQGPHAWAWEQFSRDGLRSGVVVPLTSKERFIGTFGLFGREPDAYGTREQDVLERLAPWITVAIFELSGVSAESATRPCAAKYGRCRYLRGLPGRYSLHK